MQALDGSWIVLNKNGSIGVHNADGRELESYNVVIGSVISKPDGASVKKGETFVQWDPYNVPILTDKTGKIEFRDMIAGVTIKRDVDEATGLMGTVIIEHKEDLHPQIVVVGDKKEILASYSIPAGAHVIVEEGKKIQAGALARQDSAQGCEDQGHHRRSAACGRTLRSPPSERRGRDREDRRRRRNGRNGPRQAQAHPERRRDRRGRGTPHPAHQTHHRRSRATS